MAGSSGGAAGRGVMKLPSHVEFHEEHGLLVWRPRGVINEAAVNKIIAFLGQVESRSNKPLNRFTDSLAADAIELNFRFIFHVSLFRRLSYAGRPPVKSAILAKDEAMTRYAKMHALVMQGSPLKVRVFEDREAVAKWLGLPIEALTAA
jgi:hypothetical protein